MSYRIVKGAGVAAAISALVVGFQNCSSQGFNTEDSVMTKSLSSSSTRGGVAVPVDSGSGYSSEGASINSEALQVIASSSALAKQDCSKEGSEIYQTIKNAPSSISVCAEYILDMPAGHPRFNEQSFCDSPAKFTAPNSTDWQYDVSKRQWSTRTPYKLSGGATIVPGSYWLVVRDHTGQVYRSGEIVVKRPGFGHCQSGIVVNGASTDVAKVDCSQTGAAVINQTVQNAPMDAQVCSEYTLDMPVGHARYGETFRCDSSTKFRYLFPEWSYDRNTQTFTHPTPVFNLSGNQIIVPGTYRTVVRDPSTGKLFYSRDIVVRRPGYGHCVPGGSGSQGSAVQKCYWSGIVAGPEESPAQSCGVSNQGAKSTNSRGTSFTCVCK